MMKRHTDLQDALIEAPHVAGLGLPEIFQRLVLGEELASIELRDPLDEQRRWPFVAPGRHETQLYAATLQQPGRESTVRADDRYGSIQEPGLEERVH